MVGRRQEPTLRSTGFHPLWQRLSPRLEQWMQRAASLSHYAIRLGRYLGLRMYLEFARRNYREEDTAA